MTIEFAMWLLSALFGLYVAVMGFLFKTAWNDLQTLKKEQEDLKERVLTLKGELAADFSQQLISQFDKFFSQLDEKFEAWWNKIELNLVNDGRLPRKQRDKKTDGGGN